jgi:hypothetical protein
MADQLVPHAVEVAAEPARLVLRIELVPSERAHGVRAATESAAGSICRIAFELDLIDGMRGEATMREPLPIDQGEGVLLEMLRARGVDPAALRSAAEAWAVFKDFVLVPFATGSDGVLYQTGVTGYGGPKVFYLDFVRQFEVVDVDGEHDHFEQLHCEFRYPVSDETRSFGSFNEWWFADEGEPWADFVALVETRPEFLALGATASQAASVFQDKV